MELFERIRREHFIGGRSIRSVARHYGVHRRVVRQALEAALPPERKGSSREPPVLKLQMREQVRCWLKADRKAPRKQRHTARRIYHRLVEEHSYVGVESSVRAFVGRMRRELGLKVKAFVPLSHEPGQEAEVDWYEAYVDFADGRRRVHFFQMRSCFSAREFHVAFARARQQAFLQALALAFSHFGGVFARMRFDNLGSAVKKVLRGRRRQETERFVALRSHYLFESEFCLPGLEGAHEKGGVENGVGRFRRHHLVPVPKVQDLAELNEYLLLCCAKDEQRKLPGRLETVAERFELERAQLRPLPREPFPVAEQLRCQVDSFSRVQVWTNRYSVPVSLVGLMVQVELDAHKLRVWHGGKMLAEHERLYGRHGEQLVLDHYLELLAHKPAALKQCRALKQAREAGRWPEEYERLWSELRRRHGEADGTRQLLDVLMLHRSSDAVAVHAVVRMALELGCCDAPSIAVLLRQLGRAEQAPAQLQELGPLARYGRVASVDMGDYQRLLEQEVSR